MPLQVTNDPVFINQDTVNWCQFGCAGAAFTKAQSWGSVNGMDAGTVGLLGGGVQSWVNLQQVSPGRKWAEKRSFSPRNVPQWWGNFPSGMGVIYNGYQFNSIPASIVITLAQPIFGIGAYIQSTVYGGFTGTVTLFDASNNQLGKFSSTGYSSWQASPPLFLGAVSSLQNISLVQFDVLDQYGTEDFAIGQVNFSVNPQMSLPLSMFFNVSTELV